MAKDISLNFSHQNLLRKQSQIQRQIYFAGELFKANLTNEKLLRSLLALKRLHANLALADSSQYRRILIRSGVGKRQPHGKLEVGLVKFSVHETHRAYDIAVKFDLRKFRII